MKSANLLKRISIEPTVMLGKPVIKGTRMPVDLLVEKVAFGTSIQELLEDYPFLKSDDIRAALLYSARCVSAEEVYCSVTIASAVAEKTCALTTETYLTQHAARGSANAFHAALAKVP